MPSQSSPGDGLRASRRCRRRHVINTVLDRAALIHQRLVSGMERPHVECPRIGGIDRDEFGPDRHNAIARGDELRIIGDARRRE